MQNLPSSYIALQNPEKLVKIRLIVLENSWLRGGPLIKNIERNNKKTSAKYIAITPPCRHARRAKIA